MSKHTKDIPVSAGKLIADQYGYDQVVIVARKVGKDGREHVTTYGKDKANCDVAAGIGYYLKDRIMHWVDCHDGYNPAAIGDVVEALDLANKKAVILPNTGEAVIPVLVLHQLTAALAKLRETGEKL